MPQKYEFILKNTNKKRKNWLLSPVFTLYNTFIEVEIIGGITGLTIDAHLKMKMWRCSTTRLTNKGYHLTGLYTIAFLHQVLRVVGIAGFQTVRMLDADVVAITVIDIRKDNFTLKGSIDVIVGLGLEIDTRMRTPTTLAVGADDFRSRQRKMPAGGICGLDCMTLASATYKHH